MHEKNAHSFECNICGSISLNQNEHVDHLETAHGFVSNPIAIDIVNADQVKSYPLAANLESCNICDYKIPMKEELSDHVRTCHEKCDECGKIVTNPTSMREHIGDMHSHMDLLTLENIVLIRIAENIGYDYLREESLKPCLDYSLPKSIDVQMSPLNDRQSAESSIDNQQHPANHLLFACENCSIEVSTLRDLTLHQQSCHGPNAVEFECEFCPFNAKLVKDLKKHMINHNINFTCDQCHFMSTSEFAFNLHHEEKHQHPSAPPLQTFPCPHCGLTFAEISDLRLHTDLSHIPPLTFPCSQCDLAFPGNEDLKLHTDLSHTVNSNVQPETVRIDDTKWIKQQLSNILEENLNLNEDLKEMKATFTKELEKMSFAQNQLLRAIQ